MMGQSMSISADQASAIIKRHNDTSISSSSWVSSEPKHYIFQVYRGLSAYALIFFALNILIVAALLAGLILALCSLNVTLLQLRAVTGTPKERKQARAIAQLKKNETWMLCSLILVSVAFGESFPFLIQSVYPGGKIWISVLVSTLCIAIVGEILPQYIIPRRAVAWGYHCRFLVWFCMGFTGVISYPLAWCLDRIGGQKDHLELFTNEELGGLIRHHEKSEKYGGALGQDASRVMLGALKLDSRKVGGEITMVPKPHDKEQDVEKADLIVVDGMIVKWSSVKTVCIDDRVDEAFIKKIRSWSYSRIPVIGTTRKEPERNHSDISDWSEDTRIYGFFHIKSLIGLDVKFPENPEIPLLVKDLPLYPLPIIREDMSVYELLNMFQTGMSRMAIIVPTSILTWGTGPVWTLPEKANDETMKKMKDKAKGNQWSLHFLMAAEAVMENHVDEKCDNPGIKSPKPIGIITYEDIIDMILQKTSLDEKDFYDRDTSSPPTKTRKAGDFPVDMTALIGAHASSGCEPLQASAVSRCSPEMAKNTLRRRKVTNEKTVCAIDSSEKAAKTRPSAPGAMDGAYENSSETLSGDLKIKKTRGGCIESSYTANSQGGFHADRFSHSVDNGNMLTAEHVAELAAAASLGQPKCSYESSTMRSLPPRRRNSRSSSYELKQKFRHVSAAPNLPTFRRVTPFSRITVSSLGNEAGTDLIMPEPSTAGKQNRYERMLHPNASGFDINESMEDYFDRSASDHSPEKSVDTISLRSDDDDEQDREDDLACLYDAFPVSFPRASPELSQRHNLVPIAEDTEKKYDGFPMELLNENKENRAPKYMSSTMPRITGIEDFEIFEGTRKKSPRGREESFHDDRGLLPSQRRAIPQDEESISSIRRTSLWF